MTVEEILERRVERVRGPYWSTGTYLKLDYLGDEVSPMVSYVNPGFQRKMGQKVGELRLEIQDAFGKQNDWEEYHGPIAFRF
jgi:hypothetical protein